MIEQLPKHKKLILFDGVCNLCSSSVQYAITHDKNNVFMFAALQSDVGKQVISKFNVNSLKTDSILLYSPEKESLKIKSTAALFVAKDLGFPQNLLAVFLIVPAFIRHWVYDVIAKHRYKWFGKKETCWMPTPELKAKFIGEIV